MKNRQFGLVFVVFGVTFISLTSAVTRTFDEIKFKCAKCECCKGGCNQETGICHDRTACLDGYWGKVGTSSGGNDGDCRHACYDTNPPCTSCGMGGGLWCSTCIDGYYVPPAVLLYTAPKCTLECNPGCQACVESASACTSCKPGYYDPASGCTKSCQSSCYMCNDATSCTECPAGTHGTLCEDDCPVNCVNCTSSTQCTACNSGHYGEACQSPCSPGCNSSSCDKGSGDCQPCKTNFVGTKCDMCVNDKYGINCDQNCPTGCDSRGCQRESGDCLSCNENFAGSKCENCVVGKYDSNCDNDCPQYCQGSVCNRNQGHCTKGCEYDHMEGEICDRCELGWYGSTCDSQCSIGCNQSACDRDSGICKHGCLSNFHGQQCIDCIHGSHGAKCDENCPNNCFNGTCNKMSGHCKGCSGNYFGDTCEQCKTGFYGGDCNMQCSTGCSVGAYCNRDNGSCSPCAAGYYGENCELNCSVGCSNGGCVQESGVCECKANYSGDMCCVNDMNSRCQICNSAHSCSVCVQGYYSPLCNQTCSEHCVNKTCEMSSGRCLNCDRTRYGNTCEFKCPSSCLDDSSSDRVCFRDSGHCLIGCKNGTYGEQCARNCSSNCVDSRCNDTNGFCECIPGYTGDTCAAAQTATEDPGPGSGGAIGGGVGGAVAVIVVVVILVIFVFRRRRQNAAPSTKYEGSPAAKKEAHDVAVSGPLYGDINTVRGSSGVINAAVNKNTDREGDADPESIGVDVTTENEYMNPPDNVYMNQAPADIKVAQLYSYVKSKTASVFKDDFMRFPNKLKAPYKVSQMPQNIGKNRYKGMYPYDHSRVTIAQDPNFYMNASFINGFQKNKQYIASLGPMVANSDHFVTFWKMIWYLEVEVIVMLTNLVEGGVQKCEQYWPDTLSSQTYGDVTVTCQQEMEVAEYVTRTLKLTKGGQDKYVYYFHFTVWPDKSVPDDVCSLVEFRERVIQVAKGSDSNQAPMLVHCSAGVGRTGTFIALDVLTESGEHTKLVNVPKCVETLREQRVNMIQTAAQYEYLHKCLVYKLTTDCTLMTQQDIADVINKSDSRQFAKLHKMLQVVDLNVDTEDEEARQKNAALTDKNRPAGDVPGNRWRPRLFLNRGLADSDYINAVQINTCTRRDGFIIAQTPLPATVTDFLTLVYQSQASYIVSLDDSKNRKQDEGVYQPPDNQVMKCGVFTISSEKCVSNPQYTERKLTLKSSVKSMGERVVHHFQFSQWPRDNAVPTDTTGFVQLVKIINRKLETTEEPVIVHCLSGSDRGAVFCAVSVLLEKMRVENKVSVLNTLRQIKLRRRTAFSKKEHVEFCYGCVAAGDDGKDVYYNL